MRVLCYRIKVVILLSIFFSVIMFLACGRSDRSGPEIGSVIFIHPDGSSAGCWHTLRLLERGPDGMTSWDQLEAVGVYRGHLRDSLVSSSNGGATVHAFGVKAYFGDYGVNVDHSIKSLSGKDWSIMIEARNSGKSIGVINSGQITEPGTGVFLASAQKRKMTDKITEQIIDSNADVIMSGGEVLLLPERVVGRHGQPGIRKDGKNLIELAEQLGYTVVYTSDELMMLPGNTEKVLGVFSSWHTFNDEPEEVLKGKGLPLYNEYAPSVAEMMEAALKILRGKGRDFLLVVEEEGTDNFANSNNASGTLEALSRADAAIGVALEFINNNPGTLLLTAADSNAGGLHAVSILNPASFEEPLPPNARNGAPLDGRDGTQTLPFVAAPDRFGNRLRFGIVWAGYEDVAGGILARAHGLNANRLPKNVDNTDIYRLMYLTLFGIQLP